jgi:hypothetical protein
VVETGNVCSNICLDAFAVQPAQQWIEFLHVIDVIYSVIGFSSQQIKEKKFGFIYSTMVIGPWYSYFV